MEKSFTKSGKTFHKRSAYDGLSFSEAIAKAIVADFGASPSAVRRIAKLTSASERTVRNWLDGSNGPSGAYLVGLMRHSDTVLDVTLTLAGRTSLDADERLASVRHQLQTLLANIDGLTPT